MRGKKLGEQRAAIYEKTKGPRRGSLKQKLVDKGVCLCEQQQKEGTLVCGNRRGALFMSHWREIEPRVKTL